MTEPTSSSSNDSNTVGRRRILQALGAAGLGGAAGCGEQTSKSDETTSPGQTDDGQSDTDGDQTTEEMQMVDASYRALHWSYGNPTDLQWNPFNFSNKDYLMDPPYCIAFDEYIGFNWRTQEFIPHIVKEWSLEDGALTVVLDDRFTWHSGQSFKASDVLNQFSMLELMGDPVWDNLSDVKKVNEKKVEFVLSDSASGQSEFILLAMLLFRGANIPPGKFGKFIERWEDTDEAQEDIQKDVTKFNLDQPVGTGPFKLKDRNRKMAIYERWDQHPAADTFNFTRLELSGSTQQQRQVASFQKGTFDGSFDSTTIDSINNWNEKPGYELDYWPFYNGGAVGMNNDYGPLQKREVRQALAYLIDPVELVGGGYPSFGKEVYTHIDKQGPGTPLGYVKPVKQTGWSRTVVEKYGVKDHLDEFTGYGESRVDKEKAASRLKDAGYTKQKGEWIQPDGETLTIDVLAYSNVQGYPEMAQILSNWLKNFGINSSIDTPDYTTAQQKWSEGDYHIGINTWGGRAPPQGHPWFLAQNTWLPDTTPARYYNIDQNPEVPMPVGDSEGTLTKINIEEKLNDLSTKQGEELNQTVLELAWTFNQHMPYFPNWTEWNVGNILSQNGRVGGDAKWRYPEVGSDEIAVYSPPASLIRHKNKKLIAVKK